MALSQSFRGLSAVLAGAVLYALVTYHASAETAELRLAATYEPSSPIAESIHFLIDGIKKRVGIRVVTVDADELPPAQYVQALQDGNVDVALIFSHDLDNLEGQLGVIFNQPLLFPNLEELFVYQQSYVGRAVLSSLGDQQIIGLGFLNEGFTYLASRKPIRQVADLKGQQVGISGHNTLVFTTLRALGAKAVPTPLSETEPALEPGKFDTVETSLPSAKVFGGLGVTITDFPFLPIVGIVAASPAFWNQLSEREKFALIAVVEEAARLAYERALTAEIEARNFLPEVGIPLAAIGKTEQKAFYKTAAAQFVKARPGVSHNLVKEVGLKKSPWGPRGPVTQEAVPIVPWPGGEIQCQVPGEPQEVFFASNRKPENGTDGRFILGARRDDTLHYGIATVTFTQRPVGAEHRRYFQWRGVSFSPSAEAFLDRVRARIQCPNAKSLLIFVHGYNNSFEDSIRRTASIGDDIKFRGPVIAFTWPTEGAVPAYAKDRDSALYSGDYFKLFLETVVMPLGIDSIHILSHSMGSRVVAFGLKYLNARREGGKVDTALLTNAIFGAPEIDRDLFCQNVPMLVRLAERITLYASDNDLALQAARVLNYGASPAGDIGDAGIFLADDVDAIDASSVDTSFFGLRHAYIAGRPPTLYDIFQIVHDGRAPDDRFGLESLDRDGRRFWRFRRQ